jgi:hypothetical protein
MIKIITESKEKWILKTAAASLIVFLVLFALFYNKNANFSSSRVDVDLSLLTYASLAIIIMPIIEELTFRGFFTINKWLRKIIIVAFPVIFYFFIRDKYDFSIKLVMLFFALVVSFAAFVSTKLNPNRIFIVLFISIFFGITHYKTSDFTALNTSIFVLVQFTISLFLIWVTINFGIKKSMLVHAAYNSILIIPLLFVYQFVDDSIQKSQNQRVSVQWQKVKMFSSEQSNTTRGQKQLTIKNLSLKDAVKYSYINDSIKSKLLISDPFQKYSLTIKSKDKKLYDEDIIKVLNEISVKNK